MRTFTVFSIQTTHKKSSRGCALSLLEGGTFTADDEGISAVGEDDNGDGLIDIPSSDVFKLDNGEREELLLRDWLLLLLLLLLSGEKDVGGEVEGDDTGEMLLLLLMLIEGRDQSDWQKYRSKG